MSFTPPNFFLAANNGSTIPITLTETIIGRHTHDQLNELISQSERQKAISHTQVQFVLKRTGGVFVVEVEAIGMNPCIIKKWGDNEKNENLTLTQGKTSILGIGDTLFLVKDEIPLTLKMHKNKELETPFIAVTPEENKDDKKGKRKIENESSDSFSDSNDILDDQKKNSSEKKNGKKSEEKNGGSSSSEEKEDDDREMCSFGELCYRKNEEHFKKYKHPKTTKKQKIDKSDQSSSSTPQPKNEKQKEKEEKEIHIEDSDFQSNPHKSMLSTFKWKTHDTLLIYSSIEMDIPHSKIAAFDMDSTLITTQSGNVFPKSRDDWKWLYDEVPQKIRDVYLSGWKIVILTNQAGFGKNPSKGEMIKAKIGDLIKEIGVPISVLVATKDDEYRKPNPFLWTFMIENLNQGQNPIKSIFVGDAAGRSGDFSCSDRAFAKNAGIKFNTPEQYFLNQKEEEPFTWGPVNPMEILEKKKSAQLELESEGKGLPFARVGVQEIIVLVGFPGSGKTTFSKKYLIPEGYVRISQDKEKTKEKCLKRAKEALENGSSVVIDNTNPSSETRASYINLCKSKKITCRCFYFNTSFELANHLNKFREKQTKGAQKQVPIMGYNLYRSNFDHPNEKEGFVEVKTINFVPNFESKADEELFAQFT